MNQDFDTKQVTIYIHLLNEGANVLRPTFAMDLEHGAYQVLATDDYDLSNEEWEFPPGTLVQCKSEINEGKEILIASKRIATQ